MESEHKAIGKIATILKELKEQLIKFEYETVQGYGGKIYTLNDPEQTKKLINDFIDATNNKIQAIRAELVTITRDEELVRKIMGI